MKVFRAAQEMKVIGKIPEERLKQLEEIHKEYQAVREMYEDFREWLSTTYKLDLFYGLHDFVALDSNEDFLHAWSEDLLDLFVIDKEGNVIIDPYSDDKQGD